MFDLEQEFKPFYLDWLKTCVDPYYDKDIDPLPHIYLAWWAADINLDTAIQCLLNCERSPASLWWIDCKSWLISLGFGAGSKVYPISKFEFERLSKPFLHSLGQKYPECDKDWRKANGKKLPLLTT